jgi:hypothetical protein
MLLKEIVLNSSFVLISWIGLVVPFVLQTSKEPELMQSVLQKLKAVNRL